MGTTDLLLTKFERELRPMARERLAGGQLPGEEPTRFWGGFGTGQPCSLCRKPIQPDEIEYEVRIEAVVQALQFHRVCLYAWQLECARLKRRPRGFQRPHVS